MQLELLLLINSQAGKVGKCAFCANYDKRILPCTYNKVVPKHLKEKYFSMAEACHDLAVTLA